MSIPAAEWRSDGDYNQIPSVEGIFNQSGRSVEDFGQEVLLVFTVNQSNEWNDDGLPVTVHKDSEVVTNGLLSLAAMKAAALHLSFNRNLANARSLQRQTYVKSRQEGLGELVISLVGRDKLDRRFMANPNLVISSLAELAKEEFASDEEDDY